MFGVHFLNSHYESVKFYHLLRVTLNILYSYAYYCVWDWGGFLVLFFVLGVLGGFFFFVCSAKDVAREH